MLFTDLTFNQSKHWYTQVSDIRLKFKASLLLFLITSMMSHQFHSMLSITNSHKEFWKECLTFIWKINLFQMKNSLKKRRGYFLQVIFEDICFLRHTRHTFNQLWLRVWHIIYLKIFLSDSDQEIFWPMLLITFQTLKEETSMHTCSSRGLASTKRLGSFGYACDMQYFIIKK